MAKYLVTGGAGFIGSNIVKELIRLNEEVRILDDLSTGKIENIKPILDKVEFIQGDFTNIEIAREAVRGVDYVLHQGAITSVLRSVDDPIKTNNANIVGTLNMLVASRDGKVKRFIYAASSSAYGDSVVMPMEESMKTMPKSPYAIQKLTGEEYCKNFYFLYGLETVCLRYFNVFGPNQDPESVYSAVIPLFIKEMLKGGSPIIYGSGSISRDFIYVGNNVGANLEACVAQKGVAGEVINIATGHEISLDQLVDKINTILGTDIKPIYKERRIGDVEHSLADITKAERLLGYKPSISFDEGLRKTVEFYKASGTYSY